LYETHKGVLYISRTDGMVKSAVQLTDVRRAALVTAAMALESRTKPREGHRVPGVSGGQVGTPDVLDLR
jgi:hypothetical protein